MSGKKTNIKRNMIYSSFIASILISGIVASPTHVYANEDISQHETELTNIMGIQNYELIKNESLDENFEKILGSIIKDIPDNKSDKKETKDLNFIKLDNKTINDELNNVLNEQTYMYGSYLVKVINFDKDVIGKQKITVKYRLLSMLEQKTLELTQNTENLTSFDVTDDNVSNVISTSFIIEIKDVDAPVINLSKNSEEITEGEYFSVDSYIASITDNVDTNLGYTIEGGYDSTNEGVYPFKIVVKDSSNNTSSVDFTLTVKKPATAIVKTAMSLSNSPYVWGGTTPAGFDCSGFVQYVFRQHGILLPRVAAAQGASGYGVSASEIQAGDIIIYGNGAHVGIYIGGGKVIHALNPSVGIQIGTWNYAYNGSVTAIRRVL